jgi:hypothetical protein
MSFGLTMIDPSSVTYSCEVTAMAGERVDR